MSGLVGVRVVREGDDGLRLLHQRVRDQTDALNIVGRIARAAFAENFARQGRPLQWAPLKPDTIAAKEDLHGRGIIRGRDLRTQHLTRGGGGELPGILVRTGELRNSYARRGAAGNIHKLGADRRSLEVGSSIPYAVYHETGHAGGKTIYPKSPSGVLSWIGVGGRKFAKRVRLGALPKRQVVYLTEDDLRKIEEAYAQYLTGKTQQAGVEDGA